MHIIKYASERYSQKIFIHYTESREAIETYEPSSNKKGDTLTSEL